MFIPALNGNGKNVMATNPPSGWTAVAKIMNAKR